jgi:hypothetical protein
MPKEVKDKPIGPRFAFAFFIRDAYVDPVMWPMLTPSSDENLSKNKRPPCIMSLMQGVCYLNKTVIIKGTRHIKQAN